MRSLARPVAVEEHRRLQLVAVLAGVERWRHQLQPVLRLRFLHLHRPVGDLPQQRAGVVGAQLRHGALQHVDLLSLPARQCHHQRQMRGRVRLQMRLQQVARTLEAASSLLESARHRQRFALVAQMRIEIGARERPRVAPLRTGDGAARTGSAMGGQRVGTELAATVRTAAQTFGTVFGTMDGHAAAEYARATLGLAVDRFRAAGAGVLLQPNAGELHVAELADGTAQDAGERQMVRHHYARYLGAALVRALDGIVLAGIQMCLEGAIRKKRGGNVLEK